MRPVPILAAAVLALLVLDPWLVYAIGFQLSVAATAGMVALATPIAERLGRWMPTPVALAAGTTMAAQLGVTPLLLFHFHEVPGVTIVANLAAFPAVSPALLLGIAASALGLVWLPLGDLVALLARLPMRYLEIVASMLAKAPVAWITSSGGPLVLVGGLVVFVAIAAWLRTGWRPPRRALVAGLALAPVLVWQVALGAGPPSGLTVRMLDIGQGDSLLITSPAGATVLIDGGPDDELDAQLLVSYGVKRLDAVVATHPHADHIVGLPQVLARFPVGVFLEPGCPDDTELQAALHEEIDAEGSGPDAACRRHDHDRRPLLRRVVPGSLLGRLAFRSEQRLGRTTPARRRRFDAFHRRRRAGGPAGLARHRTTPGGGCLEDAAPRRRHVAARAVPRGLAAGDRHQRRSTESVRPPEPDRAC